MSLEWVKKGTKWIYCRKRRNPLTLPWDLSRRRSLFWAGSTNLFHSHLQKYFQHAIVVEIWGHQTLNPRRARQSAIMFSALKTPQLPTWLTTGEISLKSLQIFFVFSLSPLPFVSITIQKCKNWTYNIDTLFAQFWWENHLPLVTYRWKGKIHLTLGHMQIWGTKHFLQDIEI